MIPDSFKPLSDVYNGLPWPLKRRKADKFQQSGLEDAGLPLVARVLTVAAAIIIMSV